MEGEKRNISMNFQNKETKVKRKKYVNIFPFDVHNIFVWVKTK